MDTVVMLGYILSSQGAVDREELDCNLGASVVAEILENNSDKFVSCWFNGRATVVVRSQLRLCPASCPGLCEGLHLCKKLLLSGECQRQERRGCAFLHDLDSEHNVEVLRKFGLETLKLPELRLLLLQSNNALLPSICHDYNNRNGCRGECPRLHVCERYLSGGCSCPRTHNFSDPQPFKLLRDKHIPDHLIKSIYANKQALRQAERRQERETRRNGECRNESEPLAAYNPDTNDSEGTPEDLTAYDSDSRSSISTNLSESSCHGDPSRKERRRRGGRGRRGNVRKTPSAAGGVDGRHGLYDLDAGSEPRNKTRNHTSNAAATKSVAKSDLKQSRWKKDKTEICMFFIRGCCKNEGGCPKAHDEMPYRWKIKQSGQWTPLADNEKIEEDYCDPQNSYSTTCPPVHFDTMMCGMNKVRRLSTLSSIAKPYYSHTTVWLWYFKDENGQWNQYSDAMKLFDICEQRIVIITSEELEQRYLKNNEDVVTFSSGSQSYHLSFREMIQTNLKYGTERMVRRRPRFVPAAEVHGKQQKRSTAVPDKGNKTNTGGRTYYSSAYATKTFSASSQQTILKTFSSSQSELASAAKSQFTLQTPAAPSATSPTKSSNQFSTTETSSRSQKTSAPFSAETKLTTTSSKSQVTPPTIQIPSPPKSLDTFSATSSEAQLTTATTLQTNSQYILKTSPTASVPLPTNLEKALLTATTRSQFASSSSRNESEMTLATPQTAPATKMATTSHLAHATMPSNPILKDLTFINSQLTITDSRFMLTTPKTTSAFEFATATATKAEITPQFVLATKSPNPFLMDSSSNSQLTTTKPLLPFLSPQNKSVVSFATPAVTKSATRSESAAIALTSMTSSSLLASPSTATSESHFISPQTRTLVNSATPAPAISASSLNAFSTSKSSSSFSTNVSSSESQLKVAAVKSTRSFTAEPEWVTSSLASDTNSSKAFSESSTTSQLAAASVKSSKSQVTATTSAAKSTPATESTIRLVDKCAIPQSSRRSQTIATKSMTKSNVLASPLTPTTEPHFLFAVPKTRPEFETPASAKSASSQFISEANSPNAFLTSKSSSSSSSESQVTLAVSRTKLRHSFTTTSAYANSSKVISGSLARSSVKSSKSKVTPTTSAAKLARATKSATLSQCSVTTTSSAQFPTPASQTTIEKSQVTSPKTSTKSQCDTVRSLSPAANMPIATFQSASPFGYAAVSYPKATTSATGSTTASSRATEKENKQRKSCVVA